MKPLKVGDLVKARNTSPGVNRKKGLVGIVIKVEQTGKLGAKGQVVQVQWSEGYGLYYNHREDLCLISEAK